MNESCKCLGKQQSTNERWMSRKLESLIRFYRRKRRKVQNRSLLQFGWVQVMTFIYKMFLGRRLGPNSGTLHRRKRVVVQNYVGANNRACRRCKRQLFKLHSARSFIVNATPHLERKIALRVSARVNKVS